MASRGVGSVPIHSATCSDDASMRRVSILGTPVRAIDMQSTISQIDAWVTTKQHRYICLADVHSVMRARWDKAHNSALHGADLVLPDGMPLVWTGKLRGEKAISRVCGPDLMLELCRYSGPKGWRHFLLGGTDEVLKRLSASLMEQAPELGLCGTFSPPFRQPTTGEDDDLVERLNAEKPDIVWVGLGCPKQEIWMAQHVHRIVGAVLIGVGAAFDFHSGVVPRAPHWMQAHGFEWAHRLITEPRRLWRRYLVAAPAFAALVLLETLAGGAGPVSDGGNPVLP